VNFLRALIFGYRCFRWYWATADDDSGMMYFGAERFGICRLAVVMAKGRDAWRVSHLAIEAANKL
jgi:hypothetical protein